MKNENQEQKQDNKPWSKKLEDIVIGTAVLITCAAVVYRLSTAVWEDHIIDLDFTDVD